MACNHLGMNEKRPRFAYSGTCSILPFPKKLTVIFAFRHSAKSFVAPAARWH